MPVMKSKTIILKMIRMSSLIPVSCVVIPYAACSSLGRSNNYVCAIHGIEIMARCIRMSVGYTTRLCKSNILEHNIKW